MPVKKGQLRHIRIEPDTAPGSKGAHVTISKHITEGTNKGPWLRNEDEEKKSHPSPEEAAAHVLKTLKEHFGSGSSSKTGDSGDAGVEGAKASKGGKSAKANVSHPASDDGANPSNDSY
jgi:hypothetical protein